MNKIFLVLTGLFSYLVAPSQSASTMYFGQELPSDSPRVFAPGFISKPDRFELMTAYRPDGREFCFTVTNEHWSHFEIWLTVFDGQKWSEPQPIPLGMEGFGPVFSLNNPYLYFSSANWVTHPSRIWKTMNDGDTWGTPETLDSTINSGSDQWQCSIARDGTLVFASKRAGGKGDYDLYIKEPNSAVRNLETLNSPKDEYSAFIAPDKSYIIFSSQETGGYGWDDLYISFRTTGGEWTKPLNLGPGINTIDAEFSPQVTPDGRFLIYSRWDKHNKWSDIYWVRIDKLLSGWKKEYVK
jgi:Tol biopolymer transport system component